MKKKTVVMDGENGIQFSIGEEVILLEYTNDKTGNGYYSLVKHEGQGINGCGGEKSVKYHGWRGSENKTSLFAYGVRRVTDISELYERSVKSYANRQKVYKVTVGEDIHPEWS